MAFVESDPPTHSILGRTNARPRRSWGLPLLTKELTAAAARPRTFQIRNVYANLVLLIGYIVFAYCAPSGGVMTIRTLGSGAPVLQTLVGLQSFGLYLILPIFAASTITAERERNTLDLLLITRLGSWTIILEKFLGQLVPALNLILLALPLLAFTYGLGGISAARIWLDLTGLVLLAVRLSAVGVLCSAACRTTTRALLATYCWVVVICIAEQLLQWQLLALTAPLRRGGGMLPYPIDLLTHQPGLFSMLMRNLALTINDELAFVQQLYLGALPSLTLSALLLWLARWILVPPVRGWSRWLFRANPSISTSSRRSRPERDVPDDRPVAWREIPSGNQKWWWIKHVSLSIGCPLLLMTACVVVFGTHQRSILLIIVIIYLTIWFIVTLRITAHAAVLIPLERTNRTLDVLCCTPIPSDEIVRQKMEHLWRLVCLSRISLLTCVVFRTVVAPSLTYLLVSGFMIWFFPSVIAWLSVRYSMSVRTTTMALLKAIGIQLIWYFIPIVGGILVAIGGGHSLMAFVMGISPLSLLVITEAFPADSYRVEEFGMLLLLVITSVITVGVSITNLQHSVRRLANYHFRDVFDDVRIFQIEHGQRASLERRPTPEGERQA